MVNKPKANTGKNRAKQRREEKRSQEKAKEISSIDSDSPYTQQDDLSVHNPSSSSILRAALQGFEPDAIVHAATTNENDSTNSKVKAGSIRTAPSGMSISIDSSNLRSIEAKVKDIEDEVDEIEGRGALIISGNGSSKKQTDSSSLYKKEDDSSITSSDKSSFAKILSRQSSINEDTAQPYEIIDLGDSTNLAATLEKVSLQGTELLETIQPDDSKKDNGYVHVVKHELTRSKSFKELIKRQEEQQKNKGSGFMRVFFG